MEIVVNGAARQVDDGASVEQVVRLLSAAPAGIAVAVNGDVVRRADWPSAVLRPGDQVEVVTAVQGG